MDLDGTFKKRKKENIFNKRDGERNMIKD